MNIDWKIDEFDKFTVLEFKISGDGIISPEDLNKISLPEGLKMSKGLILSGRGPVWLYVFLAHLAHPFAWVATYDPHLDKAIIIERHTKNAPQIGELIKIK